MEEDTPIKQETRVKEDSQLIDALLKLDRVKEELCNNPKIYTKNF